MIRWWQRALFGGLSGLFFVSAVFTPGVLAVENSNYSQLSTPFYDPTATTSCSSDTSTTASNTTLKGKSVYFVGDSLTVGMESGGLKSAVEQAHGTVAAVEATVGDSVDAAFPKIKGDANQIKNAQVAVVELGTNPGSNTTADAASFDPKIKEVVDYIKSVNSSVQIYWMNAYADKDPTAYSGVNRAISTQASPLGYTLIDWHSEATNNNSQYAPFAGVPGPPLVHPSTHYSDLANFVVNALNSTNTTASGSCCTDTGSTLKGDTNGVRAYNFFIDKGLTPAAAAGIVGNMTEESIGVEPERLQGDYTGRHPAETLTADQLSGGAGGRSVGWGTVQWTPPSQYISTSRQSGVAYSRINSLDYQLAFVWHEIAGTPTVTDLNAATTPEAAAEVWLKDFEKGNPAPTREAYARAYFNLATKNIALPPSVPVSKTDAGGGDAGGANGTCGSVGTYRDPYRDVVNLADAGIDAGIDYSGEGNVYALGSGTIVYISDSSNWVGGHAVAYKLSDGPAKGKTVFMAENCPVNTSLHVGDTVTNNTVICHMHNAYPYTESGWAADGTDTPQAYIDNCYYLTNPNIGHKTSTAYGINFNQLLVKLGDPKGSLLAPPVTCTLPSGWPRW